MRPGSRINLYILLLAIIAAVLAAYYLPERPTPSIKAPPATQTRPLEPPASGSGMPPAQTAPPSASQPTGD